MKTFELKGTVRADLGKKATKAVRSNGSIPCELYGVGENIHFSSTMADLRKLIYTPDIFVIDLTINGKEKKAVLKDLQFHPVTDEVLHIDLLEVYDNKPVVMEVPVKIEGHAAGVKAGGKLTLSMKKLKVKALYSQMPERIVVNVDNLELGKSLKVGELSYEGLELMNAKNAVVCAVQLTRAARGAQANAQK